MRFFGILLLLPLGAQLAAQPPVHGRVVTPADFADAIDPGAAAVMEQRAARNIEALERAGVLIKPKDDGGTADLQWPLKPVAGFDQFDYHGVSNFVDHDPRFPGFVQDYSCGTRTYDLDTGYNHAGTDYYLWPFAWLMMDQGQIQVVAAAPGIIVDKADGNFDRNCAIGSSGDPNFVRVAQDDGLSAIYLHMRLGSVTTLPIGTRVAAGDYLGLVGSSGSSSAPHMHFELRDNAGNVVDPRHGTCNDAPDRWAVFQPYEDPHIDSLSTHAAEPDQISCGFVGNTVYEDRPNYKNVFAPGETLWVFASYRDQRNGEVTNYRILRPDGSTFAQWDFDMVSEGLGSPFYSGTAWDWQFWLPVGAPTGTWRVEAIFQGNDYVREFSVRRGAVQVRPPPVQ